MTADLHRQCLDRRLPLTHRHRHQGRLLQNLVPGGTFLTIEVISAAMGPDLGSRIADGQLLPSSRPRRCGVVLPSQVARHGVSGFETTDSILRRLYASGFYYIEVGLASSPARPTPAHNCSSTPRASSAPARLLAAGSAHRPPPSPRSLNPPPPARRPPSRSRAHRTDRVPPRTSVRPDAGIASSARRLTGQHPVPTHVRPLRVNHRVPLAVDEPPSRRSRLRLNHRDRAARAPPVTYARFSARRTSLSAGASSRATAPLTESITISRGGLVTTNSRSPVVRATLLRPPAHQRLSTISPSPGPPPPPSASARRSSVGSGRGTFANTRPRGSQQRPRRQASWLAPATRFPSFRSTAPASRRATHSRPTPTGSAPGPSPPVVEPCAPACTPGCSLPRRSCVLNVRTVRPRRTHDSRSSAATSRRRLGQVLNDVRSPVRHESARTPSSS